MAEAQVKLVEEKAKGQGRAVTLCKITVAKFDEAKPYVQTLGGTYKAGFDKAYTDAVALREQAIKDNKTIYYEPETHADEINKPDAQNFVSCTSIADQLANTTHLDEVLRHLVPPAVKQMQDELGKILQQIVQDQFTNVQKQNEQLQTFLK